MPPKKKGGGKAPAPSKSKKWGEKDTEEYKMKRERNNIAVKRSREKARIKTKETTEKVQKLKDENAQLEGKVGALSKELNLLRELFLAHAGTSTPEDVETLASLESVNKDHGYTSKQAS